MKRVSLVFLVGLGLEAMTWAGDPPHVDGSKKPPAGRPETQESTKTAPLETLMACWDGTFGYNTFRVEKSATRYYVTLRGSLLTDKDETFYLNNGTESIRLHGGSDTQVTASFPIDECDFDKEKRLLKCRQGNLKSRERTAALYTTRKLDDLGKPTTIVSKFPEQYIDLWADPTDGVVLSSKFAYFDGQINSQSLRVKKYTIRNSETGSEETIPLKCDGEFAKGSPTAPEKLVTFLESQH